MIINGVLTPAQQAASRLNYLCFNAMNGFSYMCLGDTVIILLAVRLDCPNVIIAVLGAMVYFGFLLLPLGKIVTARVGAAQSQAIFWVMRNIAALLVGATPVLVYFGWQEAALIQLIIGAFLFYGFRAAGVVMGQPLIGEITSAENRAQFLGFSTGLFQVTALVSLLMISLILRISDNIWVLSGVIVLGSSVGVTSSRFLSRIVESESIRTSARKPIMGELHAVWRNPFFRSQLLTGFTLNLTGIMIGPIGMLTLKRGYAVSDTQALLFTLAGLSSSAVMSQLVGKLSAKIGPRRTVIGGFFIQCSMVILWLCAPGEFTWWYLLIPFVVGGCVGVCIGNSMTHYFLSTIPTRNRVASSMFLSVATGAGAGVAGMLLAGGLIKLAGIWAGEAAGPLTAYRIYFALVLILVLPFFYTVSRLLRIPGRHGC